MGSRLTGRYEIWNLGSGFSGHNTELVFRLQVRLHHSRKDDPESRFRYSHRVSELAEKPLRADARRNREKVLKAARAVFADEGVDAQMDDVARRADVGVGTVLPPFPDQGGAAHARSRTSCSQSIAANARAVLEIDDPWEAFSGRCGSAARSHRRRSRVLRDPRRLPADVEHVPRRGGPADHGRRDDAPLHRGGPDAPRRDDRGHPAADVRRRQRERDGAPAPGRVAAAPEDRARRAAGRSGERLPVT